MTENYALNSNAVAQRNHHGEPEMRVGLAKEKSLPWWNPEILMNALIYRQDTEPDWKTAQQCLYREIS